MVSLVDFSRIVSAIHAAAITPRHWMDAMNAVRSTFDSTSAAMITTDETGRTIHSANVPPDAEVAYRSHFNRVDYVLDAVEHGPVGLIRGGTELVALDARSEFNADWLKPYEMQDGLFVRLTDGPATTCFLVATAKHAAAFATTERTQLVSALVPHLQQALASQHLLEGLVHGADDVAAAVDTMCNGVFVVGPGSALRYLNRAAEEILTLADGPVVRSGRLELRTSSADAVLHRSIAEALGRNESHALRGNSLPCPRIDGRRAYAIHVVPYTPPDLDVGEPRALVIVVDPDRRAEPPKELLHHLYGLTRAEAEVALRVLRGDGLKPIAEELSLSAATVKTHLQHVFTKTDTHRQAELVRLLLSIVP